MAERADFETVVRSRMRLWRRLAFAICGDWVAADDLVQQALWRLYKKWAGIELAGLDAYARRVIVRLAIDESRRPHHRAELQADLPDEAVRGVDRDAALDVRAAMAELPPKHRAVLVLRFYLELSVSETAHTLRVSEGTVKSQTSRALTALRSALQAADIALEKEN